MTVNVEAVLILLWIVLAVTISGLCGLWFWTRAENRAYQRMMDRLRR